MELKDKGNWHAHWRLEKRQGDAADFDGDLERFLAEVKPYEVVEKEGNLLCNVGINLLLDLLVAGGGTPYNNANAYLAVGNGVVAAAPADTDITGPSKTYIVSDVGYPIVGTTACTWRSTFAAGDANYAWNEVALLNGNAPPASFILNHLVPAGGLGTKAAGASWTLSLVITIS